MIVKGSTMENVVIHVFKNISNNSNTKQQVYFEKCIETLSIQKSPLKLHN